MNRLAGSTLLMTLWIGGWSLPATAAEADALPALDEVLRRVLERAGEEIRNDQEFKARYAFTRIRTTDEFNSNGRRTRHQVRRSEHNPTPAIPVGSARAESAGRSASGREANAGPETTGRGRAFSKSDFVLDDQLVGRFDITLVGRDVVGGRPALVLDFRPAARKLPVRDLKDRFINQTAGRAWVDAEDFALAKAALHLTGPVNVVGGLVGTVRKCEYTLERRRTADGLWFTAQVEWRLEGRQFLSGKIIDYHETRADVRPVW